MINSSPLVQGTRPFVESPTTEFSDEIQHICIIGDGVESLCVANLFSDQSVSVSPVDSSDSDLIYGIHSFEIRQRNANVCFFRGSLARQLLNKDPAASVRHSRAIFICSDATKYSDIVASIHKNLRNGHLICLVDAPLGAALEFQHQLRRFDTPAQVSIIEVGRIYDSILVESGVMLISGLRKRIPVGGLTRNDTRKGLKVIQNLVDETVPSSNIIERGLSDVERLLRPVLALSAIFGFPNNIKNGASVSEYLMRLVSTLEWEVKGLARSYGSNAPDFLKSINDFMNVGDIASETQFDSMSDAIGELESVMLSGCIQNKIENSLSVLESDIKDLYCLLSDLGTHSHLPVATINSIVDLSSAFLGKDLRIEGRSVSSLGLVGFDRQEIVDLINN